MSAAEAMSLFIGRDFVFRIVKSEIGAAGVSRLSHFLMRILGKKNRSRNPKQPFLRFFFAGFRARRACTVPAAFPSRAASVPAPNRVPAPPARAEPKPFPPQPRGNAKKNGPKNDFFACKNRFFFAESDSETETQAAVCSVPRLPASRKNSIRSPNHNENNPCNRGASRRFCRAFRRNDPCVRPHERRERHILLDVGNAPQ